MLSQICCTLAYAWVFVTGILIIKHLHVCISKHNWAQEQMLKCDKGDTQSQRFWNNECELAIKKIQSRYSFLLLINFLLAWWVLAEFQKM